MRFLRGGLGGTMSGPEEKAMARLKCIYTNARSMGNKQEELEAIVQRAGYNLYIGNAWCCFWTFSSLKIGKSKSLLNSVVEKEFLLFCLRV